MITSLEIRKLKRTRKNFKALLEVLNKAEICYFSQVRKLRLSCVISTTKMYMEKACRNFNKLCYHDGKIILDFEKGTLRKEDISKYSMYEVRFGTFPNSGVSVTNRPNLHFVDVNAFFFVTCILEACEAEVKAEKSIETYIEKLISKEDTNDVLKEDTNDLKIPRYTENFEYVSPSTYNTPYTAHKQAHKLTRYERIALHCFKYLYSKTQSLQYMTLANDIYSHTSGTLAEDCIQTAALAICEYRYSHKHTMPTNTRFNRIKHVGFSYLSKTCYKKACNAVFKTIRAELPYKGRKKISVAYTVAENPCYIYRDGKLSEVYNSSKEVVLDTKSAYPLEFISLNSTLSDESDNEKIALLEDNVNIERDITYAELISDIYKFLPKKHADAIVYRFYHGYSVDSVASLLHVSKRTIMYWSKKDIPTLSRKLNFDDYR